MSCLHKKGGWSGLRSLRTVNSGWRCCLISEIVFVFGRCRTILGYTVFLLLLLLVGIPQHLFFWIRPLRFLVCHPVHGMKCRWFDGGTFEFLTSCIMEPLTQCLVTLQRQGQGPPLLIGSENLGFANSSAWSPVAPPKSQDGGARGRGLTLNKAAGWIAPVHQTAIMWRRPAPVNRLSHR